MLSATGYEIFVSCAAVFRTKEFVVGVWLSHLMFYDCTAISDLSWQKIWVIRFLKILIPYKRHY